MNKFNFVESIAEEEILILEEQSKKDLSTISKSNSKKSNDTGSQNKQRRGRPRKNKNNPNSTKEIVGNKSKVSVSEESITPIKSDATDLVNKPFNLVYDRIDASKASEGSDIAGEIKNKKEKKGKKTPLTSKKKNASIEKESFFQKMERMEKERLLEYERALLEAVKLKAPASVVLVSNKIDDNKLSSSRVVPPLKTDVVDEPIINVQVDKILSEESNKQSDEIVSSAKVKNSEEAKLKNDNEKINSFEIILENKLNVVEEKINKTSDTSRSLEKKQRRGRPPKNKKIEPKRNENKTEKDFSVESNQSETKVSDNLIINKQTETDKKFSNEPKGRKSEFMLTSDDLFASVFANNDETKSDAIEQYDEKIIIDDKQEKDIPEETKQKASQKHSEKENVLSDIIDDRIEKKIERNDNALDLAKVETANTNKEITSIIESSHYKKRRGRPRKNEVLIDTAKDAVISTGKEPIADNIATIDEKIKSKEEPNSEIQTISEKVNQIKKKKGRRSKKNPFFVVVSKEEKPKEAIEEDKKEAISSIKDAISSTLKKVEPATVRKVIEPLADLYHIPQAKALSFDAKQNAYINRFIDEVERFLVHEMYVDRTSKIILAVSGGVDSIVMLDVMALLADKYKFSLFVAHYNHNLRENSSEKDQEFVRKASESYNLPFYNASGKVRQYAEKNGISIEQASRFLRYSFLERTSRNLKADFVATAHTADDSSETFLLNLLRGSGLTGLSGIPYRRQFVKDVLLIRPFINFNKSGLIKYAGIRNIKWREDETNALQNYTRNKIRHDLIPKLANDYNPSIIEIINRTAKLMQGADRIIHGYVRNHLQSVITDINTDRFSIKLSFFQTFDRFIQGEMLQSALMKYFRIQPLSMNIIDRIVALQDSEISSKCAVTKTIHAVKDRGVLVFAKKQFLKEVNTIIDRVGKFKVGNVTIVLKEVQRKSYEPSKNPNIEYFDYDAIPPALFIRNWNAGDSFNPLGMKGNMKVSDFLTNQKCAFVDRQNVLVLASKSEVIWVLGMRIGDKFKVRNDTEKVLRVEIRYSEK